jgi:FtsZ-binding cell division protein ZapB
MCECEGECTSLGDAASEALGEEAEALKEEAEALKDEAEALEERAEALEEEAEALKEEAEALKEEAEAPPLAAAEVEEVPQRRSAASQRGIRSVASETYTASFSAGPLQLNLEARGEYGRPYVTGFPQSSDGGMGQAEASGVVQLSDILCGLDGADLEGVSFHTVVRALKTPAPKTLTFRRHDAPPLPQARRPWWCCSVQKIGAH